MKLSNHIDIEIDIKDYTQYLVEEREYCKDATKWFDNEPDNKWKEVARADVLTKRAEFYAEWLRKDLDES